MGRGSSLPTSALRLGAHLTPATSYRGLCRRASLAAARDVRCMLPVARRVACCMLPGPSCMLAACSALRAVCRALHVGHATCTALFALRTLCGRARRSMYGPPNCCSAWLLGERRLGLVRFRRPSLCHREERVAATGLVDAEAPAATCVFTAVRRPATQAKGEAPLLHLVTPALHRCWGSRGPSRVSECSAATGGAARRRGAFVGARAASPRCFRRGSIGMPKNKTFQTPGRRNVVSGPRCGRSASDQRVEGGRCH